MKKIIPNLAVENCRDALEYYREIFRGEVKNVQTAEGKEMFKGHEGKIIHAELHVNPDCIIYLNDIFEEPTASGNISIVLQLESRKEIEGLFEALAGKGNVRFELQKTFWGSYHAVVTDCHGITWSMDYAEKS